MAESFSNSLARAAGIVTSSSAGTIGITTNRIAGISTALVSGWEKCEAAKFSFILGIPSISLAAIVEFFSSYHEFTSFSFFPLIVGLITTFLSSLFAIDFLLKYFSSNGLKLFIIYRVIFSIVIFLNL